MSTVIDYESKIFDYKTIRALEYGSFKVAHEDFLLSDWTSELYDYFLQRARSQNFQFKSEFGEILDNSVVGDAASLKRVMMALFELSAVVIPQNRVVTFRVEQLSDFAADYTFLRLVLRASGDTVRKDAVDALVIASPITAGEDAAHLLELAKKMLGIMHGSLTVQVREKQDITFTVAIPLYRHAYVNDTTKKINKLDTPECYDLSKLRVLVGVENQVEREIMVAVFERFHIKTDTAVNGGEVIGKFLTLPGNTYNCIITDFQFADMTAAEVAKRIRGSSQVKATTIPILAMTDSSFPEAAAIVYENGMNDCLRKPIDFRMLLRYFICLVNEK